VSRHGDTCDFEHVVIALRAEISANGIDWEGWGLSISADREEPRSGDELRKIMRSYGRVVTSAISTLANQPEWVRVVAACCLTERTVGMDVRGFYWPTRTYEQSAPRSWIICDNPRECEQWRVMRITKRVAHWGSKKGAHAKERGPWYRTRSAMVGGVAALALMFSGVGAKLATYSDEPPTVAGPAVTPKPTRTEVVKIVRVETPGGETVDVPVGGSEEETRRAITQVVQKTLDDKRKGKTRKGSPHASKPSPSATESPKGKGKGKDKNESETGNEGAGKPNPEETGESGSGTNQMPNVMPVSVMLDEVLPKPADDPEAKTRFLAAPPPELRLFSQQLAAMGDVSGETAVTQSRTMAMAATVDIKGSAEPVTVAAAVTTEPFAQTSTVEVATAKTEDDEPVKQSEEAPRKDTDETVTRVGVTAVMDAVDAAPEPANKSPEPRTAEPSETPTREPEGTE
jgi:hypothetical protein